MGKVSMLEINSVFVIIFTPIISSYT